MHRNDIHIRDPFILPYEGQYYLYASNWPHGFKAYSSKDLENWSTPVEIIRFSEDFWAKLDFFAPEVHIYNGSFYLFATLRSDTSYRGVQIFKAASPLGPFTAISDGPVTPSDWSCLDGTLYVSSKGTPYMVFCHEWTQIKNGTVCYAQLSDDLTHFVNEPKTMFSARDYSFVKHITDDTENFVTDGPFLYRCQNGDLLLLWSSFGKEGYLQSVLKSDNGEIDGNWIAQPLLFEKDGGHGMLFHTFDGTLKLALHTPNRPAGAERMALFDITEDNGTLVITSSTQGFKALP